jgi:hypothetical protein
MGVEESLDITASKQSTFTNRISPCFLHDYQHYSLVHLMSLNFIESSLISLLNQHEYMVRPCPSSLYHPPPAS